MASLSAASLRIILGLNRPVGAPLVAREEGPPRTGAVGAAWAAGVLVETAVVDVLSSAPVAGAVLPPSPSAGLRPAAAAAPRRDPRPGALPRFIIWSLPGVPAVLW
jgi:hypothetical protein